MRERYEELELFRPTLSKPHLLRVVKGSRYPIRRRVGTKILSFLLSNLDVIEASRKLVEAIEAADRAMPQPGRKVKRQKLPSASRLAKLEQNITIAEDQLQKLVQARLTGR